MTSEIREEIIPIMVTLQCDCGGTMHATGQMKPTKPPVYQHTCEACGDLRGLHVQYPHVEYRSASEKTVALTKLEDSEPAEARELKPYEH